MSRVDEPLNPTEAHVLQPWVAHKNPELPIGTFSLGPKPKKRPRQCPWCKQKGQSWQGEDGFWYVGCNGGFCSVSPRTSGQETEEQAIEIWNSWK